MCGIYGHTVKGEWDMEASRSALHTLSHRGPDQWSDWHDTQMYIGHRRLSILDLSEHGRQPMIDEERGVVMTVNGEIYNYQELRKELKDKYPFTSTSDSQVLLFGYSEWGIDGLLERIDGMYAFVIYDQQKKKLFLARDRSGIKPLYYADIQGQFAYASELKALEKHLEGQLEVDYTAMYDFLTYLYVPTPKSMYKQVFKLPPAHYLELNLTTGRFDLHPYWKLEVSDEPIALDDAAEQLRYLLRKSVDEQMMSDVPVGFFLSGGLDSSSVVAMASEVSDNINTFAIGFDDKGHDETHFAQVVAKHFGTYHRKEIVDKRLSMEFHAKRKDWYDEPYASSSAVPTYMVSRFTRNNATVALTGDGGDEVFGGYKWYQRFNLLDKKILQPLSSFHKPINWIKESQRGNPLGNIANKLEYGLLKNPLDRYAKLMGGMWKNEKSTYANLWEIPPDYDDYWHFRRFYKEELPVFTRLQFLDFHTYLPDDIFTKVDRASMAVSLEARVPLLATDLVEFAFSLPESIRYHNGQLKGLLKYAMQDILPQSIIQRGKQGFSLPVSSYRNLVASTSKYKQDVPVEILKQLYSEELQLS